MLPKTYLKFVASSVVYESALSKYAKVQLMRFIENASSDQLYFFINEGRISNESLSEAFVVPAMLLVAATSAAKLAYDRVFSDAARYCSNEETREARSQCIKNYKIRANRAKLTALRREMPKCDQTNNVKKCRETFMKHIQRIEKDMERLRR